MYLSFGSIAGKFDMVQTRNNSNDGSNQPDLVAAQLAAIAAMLESIDTMREDIAALKAGGRSRGGKNDEGENSSRGRQPYRPHNKIDFPTFSGGDPCGWLLKAEKYFRYYQIPDEEMVEVASMHLEGDALDLYSWLSNDQPIMFWEELVQAFTKNFGPAEFQNPDEFLCSIKQNGSVQEYRQEFAKRSARVSNWPDHCLLGVFLNGLKDELKSDVRIHKPRTVYKAVSLALEFESKISHTPSVKNVDSTAIICADPKPASSSSVNQVIFTQKPTENRLTDTEKQSRYQKGECFRCGEKYSPGHRCKSGTFKLLEMADVGDKTEAINEQNISGELAEISLHALFGQPTPTTMKLQGTIGTTEVLVLIDSGSTHNFISDQLVNNLQITSQPITPFGVQIGNGNIIRCNQMCKDVSLKLSDLIITQDCLPFPLGGADLVLGIQWLATLNTVQANWAENIMIFTVNGQEHKLQGLQPEAHNSATCHHLAVEPFEEQLMIGTYPSSLNRLEDKSFDQEGSNDKGPAMYSRRKNQVTAVKVGQFSSIFGNLLNPLT